jgi:RNA polymerase sigma-70 factor (ECF subfamily)
MAVEEQTLVSALKARDPEALDSVFRAYSDKIYRLAANMLNDEQQADGVVQDTFLKLIQHIDKFEGRSAVGTWLYRVAYNECLQRIRRAKPQLDLDDMTDDDLMPSCLVNWDALPEQAITNAEAMDEMQSAVESLSPTLRAVFVLRDIEELSVKETASILEISESAVKVRLHRARLALRERLALYFEHSMQNRATS